MKEYTDYIDELEQDLLYGSHELMEPVLREEKRNPDLHELGRQWLE